MILRPFLAAVARIVIASLLFAQGAVAAFPCDPVMGEARVAAAAQAPSLAPDEACDMAASWANVCAEHCRYGDQSDQSAKAAVPEAVLVALYPIAPAVNDAARLPQSALSRDVPAAPEPPKIVLHCCLRA